MRSPKKRQEPQGAPKAEEPSACPPHSPPYCRPAAGAARAVPPAPPAGGGPAVPRHSARGDRALFSVKGGERRRSGGRANREIAAAPCPGSEKGNERAVPGRGALPRARCPFNSTPPKCRRGFMCSLYRTCCFSLTLGSGSGRPPLVGSAERRAMIGGGRAAPPRPCPAGCAAGGAGQVAAMAAGCL